MKVINEDLILNSSNKFKDKKEVFELIAKTIKKQNKNLITKDVISSLEERELEGTTGIGEGISIPHASINIESPKIVLVRLDTSIDWNSIDNKKVDLVVSILVPNDENGRKEHFKILTNFSRSMLDQNFIEKIRKGSAKEITSLINELSENIEEEKEQVKKEGVLNVVAITSCAVGIAHTYMAAEAIEKGAKSKGFNYKVEKRGSIGTENKLTKKDIEEADICIIASEVNIDASIFEGKRLYVSSAAEAIKMGEKYISKAVKNAMFYKGESGLKKSDEKSNISFENNSTTWKKFRNIYYLVFHECYHLLLYQVLH